MSNMLENLFILRSLWDHASELQDLLGDDWPEFRQRLLDALKRLAQSEDDRQIAQAVDDLLELGLESPAAGLFRELLSQAAEEAGTPRSATRLERTFDYGIPLDPTTAAPVAGREDVIDAARRMADELTFGPPHASMVEPPRDRYFNTFFTEPDNLSPIAAGLPLVKNQPYHLYVEIHPERRGLGEEDIPVPMSVLPDEVLEQWRQGQENLPITVWAASRDFRVEHPQVKTLWLPFEGPSEGIRFQVRPLRQDLYGYLQVDLFYKGHLLQSKQVSAWLTPAPGAPVPDSPRPVQSAHLTFTANARLDLQSLKEYPERILTINVERDQRDGSLDFRFLDSRDGANLRYFDTPLQSQSLQELVDNVRKQLLLLVKGVQEGANSIEGYEWIVDGDAQRLNAWLPRLAEIGRSLHAALLPQNDGQPGLSLEPGTVIQVNPVVGLTTIPWGLLYERDVMYLSGLTRVCPDFTAHGPAGCPHAADPLVVCPYDFWGYRYAIEQIPGWVSGEMPQLPTLVRQVDNGKPLQLNLNVWRDFSYWQDHSKRITDTGVVNLLVAEEFPQMRQIWQEHGSELDIIYFYSHGGVDELIGPYLELSDHKIGKNILSAMGARWPRHPLVLLIGCATGDYGPESYASLIDVFRTMNASGIIGTECLVPEMFADAYISALLPRLFRGERLGQAMLAVRREFLIQKLNPLGLVYSLYAPNEVSLAHPIL